MTYLVLCGTPINVGEVDACLKAHPHVSSTVVVCLSMSKATGGKGNGMLAELCDALHLIESRCCVQDLEMAVRCLYERRVIQRCHVITSSNVQGRQQCLGQAT
jgi:hypothetical protein